MKNIFERARRFGSPISPRIGSGNSQNATTTTATKVPTMAAATAADEDPENDRYNEYEHKYEDEITLHKTIFTDIYESRRLGNDGSIYYRGSSGTGATFEYNQRDFVPFLRQFLIDNQIQSVVDLGCGNLHYDRRLYSEVAVKAYYGYDVYSAVQVHNRRFSNHKKYHFFTMDFLAHKEEVVSADLCIIKDVLQHWLLADIYALLDYFVAARKFRQIMIVNCSENAQDWSRGESSAVAATGFKTGDWRKLSCTVAPLKRYGGRVVLQYRSKEVSVITCAGGGAATATGPATNRARTVSPFSRNLERDVYRAIAESPGR